MNFGARKVVLSLAVAVFESGCCLSSSAQNRDLGMLSRSADNLPIYALLGSNNGEMTVTFSNHLKLICLLSWYVNVSSFLLNSENICASLLENFPFLVSVVPFFLFISVPGNFMYSLLCPAAGVQKDRARSRVQGGRVHRLPHEALLPMQDARFSHLCLRDYLFVLLEYKSH